MLNVKSKNTLNKRIELGVLVQCVCSEGEGRHQDDPLLPHHPSEMQLSAFSLLIFSLCSFFFFPKLNLKPCK